MGRIRDAGRRAFTLIELMIVVIIVAILAAAAVPIYNSFTSRAYGTEVQTALSTIRTAQRAYKAAKGSYAGSLSTLESEGFISQEDFNDMQYVEWSELSVPSSDPGSGDDIAQWAGDIDGYNYSSVSMNTNGTLDKTESGGG